MAAIKADPADWLNYSAYADFLEECGERDRALAFRWMCGRERRPFYSPTHFSTVPHGWLNGAVRLRGGGTVGGLSEADAFNGYRVGALGRLAVAHPHSVLPGVLFCRDGDPLRGILGKRVTFRSFDGAVRWLAGRLAELRAMGGLS